MNLFRDSIEKERRINMNNKPNYVAKKSILPAFKFWRVVLFFLIVPIIMIVCDIIKRRCYSVEFYDNYVIEKSGVLNKEEKKKLFPKILNITTKVNFLGYGDLKIDVMGEWDVDLTEIKKPKELRAFLESHSVDNSTIDNINGNIFNAAMTTHL